VTLLDALGTEPQYRRHVLPAWLAVQERGVFWTPDEASAEAVRRRHPGEDVRALTGGNLPRPVLVGSYRDHAIARRRRAPAVAYMEHGTGQSYGGDRRMATHPAYAGGGGHEGVGLFLAPNVSAALRWSARYPAVPVHVIGATRVLPPPEPRGAPLLVVSFHWQGAIPELRGALAHYRSRLRGLSSALPVAGHAHPRFAKVAERVFRSAGIPFIQDLEEVAERATVYAVDNSSTLWELGLTRPVVALNAPWYRRDVDHGLRFWSHAGLQVDDPDALVVEAGRLLDGVSELEGVRRVALCRDVIPHLDGARRAGTLLSTWLLDPLSRVQPTQSGDSASGVSVYPRDRKRVAASFLEGQSPDGGLDGVLAAG
jgi:hypothetical protein